MHHKNVYGGPSNELLEDLQKDVRVAGWSNKDKMNKKRSSFSKMAHVRGNGANIASP